jgi:3-oxoacyl-[acyl-carrier-protein] synthase II
MSRTRVVVTGLGTTNPLGGDVASTWEGLLAGRSGVRQLGEIAEGLSVTIGAPAAVDPTEVLDRVVARRLDRSSQLAMVAAMEAWADSGLAAAQESGDVDGERVGVAFASGIGGIHTLLSNHSALLD